MLTRRDFLRSAAVGAAGAAAATRAMADKKPAASGDKPARPNIVWLMSEDNSKHYLKLFNEHGGPTPRIAQMAEHGSIFPNAFSNCPVCSPARSTLATGCYASRLGMQFHRPHTHTQLPAGLAPIPALMRSAGYYTSNHTKTDYNFKYKGETWHSRKDWRGRKAGQPFFHKQTFTSTHEGKLFKLGKGEEGGVFVAPCHPDTPLFREASKAYREMMTALDAQIGQVLDKLTEDGVLEETFVFYFGDNGGVLPRSKGYLYETGLNVPLVVRIPEKFKHLVDIKPGSEVEGFVSFVDFAPTILHLVGAKAPAGMDGRAFMGPGVTLADLNARDEAFGIADRMDEKYDMVRTLRKGRYKYMRNYQPFNFDGLWNDYRYKMKAFHEWWELHKAGKLKGKAALFYEPKAPEALYDIEADPYEVNDLSGDPAHAKVLAALRDRLSRRVKGLPDLSFFPESELDKQGAFADPVGFGRRQKERIAQLVDTADLALAPFADAAGGIEAALSSDDPWQRYWGLNACSCFGKRAERFVDAARKLAAGDAEPLVRVRAAEFLALIGAADPRPVIMDVLATADHPLEALLTLNTVVMLRDGQTACEFDITAKSVKAKDSQIDRRLRYLCGAGQRAKR